MRVPVKRNRKTTHYEEKEVPTYDGLLGAIFCAFCGVSLNSYTVYIYAALNIYRLRWRIGLLTQPTSGTYIKRAWRLHQLETQAAE